MVSLKTPNLRTALCLAELPRFTTCPRCLARRGLRFASTESEAPPPLLSKIRNDLKTAMKSKDSSRLNVLRSVIAEAGNASKTSSPIRTNVQVLSILRKKLSASKTASQEFADAKREDLKQKQDAEIAVLDEYAGQVETVTEDKILEAVEEAVKSIGGSGAKTNPGTVMKELFRPGGGLENTPVEKAQVAAIVKRRLA